MQLRGVSLLMMVILAMILLETRFVVSNEEDYEDYFDHLMLHENQEFGFDAHHEDTPEEQDMYSLLDPDHSLLVASEHGKVDKIKEALARGAHMGTRNNFGVSPLIFASNNGHIDAVRYLLDIGAELDTVSNNGRTALMWAAYWGHLEVVQYLVARGAMIDAVDFGKWSIVEYSLAAPVPCTSSLYASSHSSLPSLPLDILLQTVLPL